MNRHKKKHSYQIFIKFTFGDCKTFTLDVAKTDTLGTLKRNIQAKSGIKSKEFRLMLDGRDLEDDKSIVADCNIKAGNTIRVSFRLPGGMIPLLNTSKESNVLFSFRLNTCDRKRKCEGLRSGMISLLDTTKESNVLFSFRLNTCDTKRKCEGKEFAVANIGDNETKRLLKGEFQGSPLKKQNCD